MNKLSNILLIISIFLLYSTNSYSQVFQELEQAYISGAISADEMILNNIFAVGAFGEVLHFNGISWISHQDETYISGSYTALSVLADQIVIVGGANSQAVITIGQRL